MKKLSLIVVALLLCRCGSMDVRDRVSRLEGRVDTLEKMVLKESTLPARRSEDAKDLEKKWAFEDTFDDNKNWEFNGNYKGPNFKDYPGIKGWENGPLSGGKHLKGWPYLNIVDGVVSGCNSGYGALAQMFEPTMMHREISLDGTNGFEVEFRAVSGSSNPNCVSVYLLPGWERGNKTLSFYEFKVYGESANRTIDLRFVIDGTEPWVKRLGNAYYRHSAGSLVNSWHIYTFRRLKDGGWELLIDGKKCQSWRPPVNKKYNHFNRIGIETLRKGSKIDWVKVRPLTAMDDKTEEARTVGFRVVETVKVGHEPVGIVVSPDGKSVYVATGYGDKDDALTVIQHKYKYVVTETIRGLGRNPTFVALNRSGSRAYVTNCWSNQLSVVDLKKMKVSESIDLGQGSDPMGVAVASEEQFVCVTLSKSGELAIVDMETKKVFKVPVGKRPYGVAISPDDKRAYVAVQRSNKLAVVDLKEGKLMKGLAVVCKGPYDVVLSRDGKTIYVTNEDADTISIVEAASCRMTGSMALEEKGPRNIAISPDGRYLYVTHEGPGMLKVISTASKALVATVNVGKAPQGVAVSPDGKNVFVANAGSNTVSVIEVSEKAD